MQKRRHQYKAQGRRAGGQGKEQVSRKKTEVQIRSDLTKVNDVCDAGRKNKKKINCAGTHIIQVFESHPKAFMNLGSLLQIIVFFVYLFRE